MRLHRALRVPPPLAAVLLLAAACGRRDDATRTPAPAAADSARKAAEIARADLARITGDTAAKVWVLIVSDFQCPYCKVWHDETGGALRREYVDNGKVRLAYMNYPLSNHQQAVPAAEAAMCAGAQGKFWGYHDALFATQERWSAMADATPVYDSLATALALDVPAYRQCVGSHVMRPLIEADYDKMKTAGTGSTPTFFIGSTKLVGAQSIAAFRPVLDTALARAAAKP